MSDITYDPEAWCVVLKGRPLHLKLSGSSTLMALPEYAVNPDAITRMSWSVAREISRCIHDLKCENIGQVKPWRQAARQLMIAQGLDV